MRQIAQYEVEGRDRSKRGQSRCSGAVEVNRNESNEADESTSNEMSRVEVRCL